jgi:hypothetical protein
MGTVDVDGLAERMPMDLVREWRHFYDLEPWGDDWRRSGRMVALLGAALGGKCGPDFERKFLPTYREEEPEPVRQQTEAEMIAELRKIPAFAKQLEGR